MVNLFENAYYIFTPSSLTSPDTLEEMKGLLSGLHARFIEIDAKEHDRVTSQISHFSSYSGFQPYGADGSLCSRT